MTLARRGAVIARSALGLVVLLGLVPGALAWASRQRFGSINPLAGVRPPWRSGGASIGETIGRPLDDDTVADLILRACLIVAWVAVIVVIVTTALEVVHLVRHRGLPSPKRRGLTWAQPAARMIAVGIVALLPMASRTAAGSSPVTPVTSGLAERASLTVGLGSAGAEGSESSVRTGRTGDVEIVERLAAAGGSTRTSADAPHPDSIVVAPGERVHVVERGESVWSIAERLTGGGEADTMRLAEAILDRNLGTEMIDGSTFTSPAIIQPGWQLVVPDAGASPTEPGGPSNVEPTPNVEPALNVDPAPVDVHVVEAGDTLSSIAAEHLGDAAEWPAIAAENAGEEMGDGRVFRDPNVIVPGWELDLPDAERSTGDVSPPPVDEAEPSVAGDDPGRAEDPGDRGAIDVDHQIEGDWFDTDSPDEPTPVPSVRDESTPAPADPSTTAPTTTAPTTTAPTSTAPTTTTAPASTGDSAGDDVDRDGEAPAAPAPLGIEHAAMLAAGVLTVAAVRRRRRLRAAAPRSRVPEPAADVVTTSRTLAALGRAERSARFDVAVRALAHQLVETGVRPGAFLHGADGTIEVVLDGDASLAPPWVGGGASWELPAATPIELISGDARHVGFPCPAVVAVGMIDDIEVLVDLEAAGVLTVAAPAAEADAVISAMAATFATSLAGETAHIVNVGLPAGVLFGHPNAVEVDDVAAAEAVAARAVGAPTRRGLNSFDLRTRRTGGEDWEPAVVFCGAGAAGWGEREIRSPGDGDVAFVGPELASGDAAVDGEDSADSIAASVGARLIGEASGWRLDAFGWSVALTPFGLDGRELTLLEAVVADAEASPIRDDGPAPDAANESGHDGLEDLSPAPSSSVFEPPAHQIIVRVLGGVSITDVNGETRSWQRSKTVELIAWMATHRARSTRSAARTAMWAEDVRDATFSNVVSEARRGLAELVEPADGDEWIPRTLTDELPLHPHVVTDLDLNRARLDAARLAAPAEAIEILRPALEFVTGLPFASTAFLWPDADGLVTDATLAATSLCTEVAEHALSLGDVALVHESTAHGLAVLPGHEDLIGLRMRAHAAAGDLAAVRQEWEGYERVLNADAWSDGEPAPALVELRRTLLAR